ncbi:MAG: rhomboid family intramembrane serine protease [Lachnospiraceae bacterium]|jgi:hypothetical protein|nr:rhomboid family intramembrane serine protease [Lachnospiraceae bacterium]
MSWLDKLERKIGKYCIHRLSIYIVFLYGAGMLLSLFNQSFYDTYLSLNASQILKGQVWRIVTFLISPPTTSWIFAIFVILLYYFIATQLEHVWGDFRFNVYFFSGVIFHVIAAMVIYFITGISFPLSTEYLNFSLFFAFAALFPNQKFYVYFVLPVKVKYLAWIDAAFFGYTILQAFLPAYGGGPYGIVYKANAIAAIISIANFLIYFITTRKSKVRSRAQIRIATGFKRQMSNTRPTNIYPDGAKHRCAVCGKTDISNPEMEFRYCSKCNGNYEYCQDHLFTHTHVE